ncbi:MAG: hypothetical protein AB7F28_07205 [Candidatus Margulisiibacteriota bacterium]
MKKILIFILLPIFMTVLGELMLKHSLNKMGVAIPAETVAVWVDRVHPIVPQIPMAWISKAIEGGLHLAILASHLPVVLSLLTIVVGGVLWLIAMSKFEISFLYPFLSINYLVILAGSALFLGEKVSLYRCISATLIVIGLVIMSRSPNREKPHDSPVQKEP